MAAFSKTWHTYTHKHSSTACMLPQAHVTSVHVTGDEVNYVHGVLGQTLRSASPCLLVGGEFQANVTDATKKTNVRLRCPILALPNACTALLKILCWVSPTSTLQIGLSVHKRLCCTSRSCTAGHSSQCCFTLAQSRIQVPARMYNLLHLLSLLSALLPAASAPGRVRPAST